MISKLFQNQLFCHPERSEGSQLFGNARFFASLRMTFYCEARSFKQLVLSLVVKICPFSDGVFLPAIIKTQNWQLETLDRLEEGQGFLDVGVFVDQEADGPHHTAGVPGPKDIAPHGDPPPARFDGSPHHLPAN